MRTFPLSLIACAAISAPSARAFSPRTSAHASPVAALRNKFTTTTEARNATDGWSLETDWILEDVVPRYTVAASSSGRRATFWNQLKHDIPAFQDVSENEIELRFRALHHADAHLHCGPAPPTLDDWWVDETNNFMGGLTESASIWFYIQGGGSLNDVPVSTELRYTPGGFVEAKDGLIYELGPAAAAAPLASPAQEGTAGMHQSRDLNVLKAFYRGWPDQVAAASSPSQFLLDSAWHTRKLLLVAIVASSVLSGTLAYGIGQGVGLQIPLSSPHAESIAPNVQMVPSACTRDAAGAAATVNPSSAPSVQELRVRQELRLIRERKAQSYLDEAIRRDEARLSDLQREETRQEGAALGY